MLIRFVVKTVLQKEVTGRIILYDQNTQQKNDTLDAELALLIRQGDINEAENLLFETLRRSAHRKTSRVPCSFISPCTAREKRSSPGTIFPRRKLLRALPMSKNYTAWRTSFRCDVLFFFVQMEPSAVLQVFEDDDHKGHAENPDKSKQLAPDIHRDQGDERMQAHLFSDDFRLRDVAHGADGKKEDGQEKCACAASRKIHGSSTPPVPSTGRKSTNAMRKAAVAA